MTMLNITSQYWSRFRLGQLMSKLDKITVAAESELISMYIPPDKTLAEISGILRAEYDRAKDIRSDTVRTHIRDILSRIDVYMGFRRNRRGDEKMGGNGLVIFGGVLPINHTEMIVLEGGLTVDVDEKEHDKIELHYITPPKPVKYSIYRCDHKFWLKHLKQLYFTHLRELNNQPNCNNQTRRTSGEDNTTK